MYYFIGVAFLLAVCNGQEIVDTNDVCQTRNGYYAANNSCDAYYDCRDNEATMMICPDGLNYNPNAVWPSYPCNYPADVPCNGRTYTQPPQPTPECPRQYGFFRSPFVTAEYDCGQYRLCAEGRSYDMFCPYGLAFDFKSARCDWPDRVPGCNFEAFFDFTCPDTVYNRHVTNYKYEDNCNMFFSCQYGHARLLSCDPGFAFDPDSATCVNADLVTCEYNETTEDYIASEPNETTA